MSWPPSPRKSRLRTSRRSVVRAAEPTGSRRRRRRGCLRRTRRRKTSRPAAHRRRHAWIAVPHSGSAHASAFPLHLLGPAGQFIDTRTMAVIPAASAADTRGGASSHHSKAASARPLPPPTHEAEHHLITARRPVSARFRRRHTRRSTISSQRGGQCQPASAAEVRPPPPFHARLVREARQIQALLQRRAGCVLQWRHYLSPGGPAAPSPPPRVQPQPALTQRPLIWPTSPRPKRPASGNQFSLP